MRFGDILRNGWRYIVGSDGELAAAVVAACRREVLRLVWEQAAKMTTDEARGYIWARAVQPVDRVTTQVLRDAGLKQKRKSQVAMQAIGLLVGGVLEDLSEFRSRQSTRAVNRAA
jgi:hypothetical protein